MYGFHSGDSNPPLCCVEEMLGKVAQLVFMRLKGVFMSALGVVGGEWSGYGMSRGYRVGLHCSRRSIGAILSHQR